MNNDYGQWNPQIDHNLCIGCKQCVEACPTNALAQVDDKAQLVRPNACIYCFVCDDICPQGAIELPFLIITKNQKERETR